MTDTTAASTATQQQASTQTTSDQTGATTTTTTTAPFYESFQDTALKANPRIHRLASPEDMARSLINAESRLGVPEDQLLRLPSDPKDEAGMRAIFTKLGLPEKAADYGIQLDAKASDADKAMLNDMLETAHKAGVPAAQTKALVSWWQQKGADFQQQQQQAAEQARVAGETELKTAWGAQFDVKAREIGRLARDLGGPELATELDGGKLGNHPQLAKMLGAMVDKMAEPGGNPRGDTPQLNGRMTPAQAAGALATLNGDPIKSAALTDRNHPQHASVLKERNSLLAMRDGKEPT